MHVGGLIQAFSPRSIKSLSSYVLAWALAWGSLSLCQAKEFLKAEPAPVADLAYGEILYQYFQDSDFSALTSILIAQKQQELNKHKAEAKVLQGRLYLRYGLQNKAEKLLQGLISQPIARRTKSELYFLLAESRYQVGDTAAARTFLARIDESHNQRFFDEFHHLSASLAMNKGEYEQANRHLNTIRDDANLAAFARYNHGIALLGLKQSSAAIDRFNTVLRLPARTSVEKNLVDKTALTLGYYHLQNQAPQSARRYLLSVRESSQFANRALLGLGWSYLNETDFRKALAPWKKLIKGDRRDIAVQEGLLALPFAYQSLNANQQALTFYQQASQSYEQEIVKLKKVISRVNKGELLPLFRQHSDSEGMEFQNSWQQKKLNLSTSEHNYYLVELLASKRFYFTFRDYQNLSYLKNNVAHWMKQVPLYTRMIKENSRFYQRKIPKVKRQLNKISRTQLNAKLERLKRLRQRTETVEGQSLLATKDEKSLLNTVGVIKKSLNKLRGKIDLEEQEEKLKFLEGVLVWQLDAKKIDRQWQATKLIWDSQEQLEKLDRQMTSTARSSDIASSRFNGFDRRLNQLKGRLRKANKSIDKLLRNTERKLNSLAVQTLKERLDTIEQLRLQADLATARLLDKTYSSGTSP